MSIDYRVRDAIAECMRRLDKLEAADRDQRRINEPTSGPWEWQEHPQTSGYRIVGGVGSIIAEMPGQTRPSNAQLIAAAPDMLQALKNVRGMLESAGRDLGVDVVDSAIRKAEGRS